MRKHLWSFLHFIKVASFIQLSYKGILDEYGWLKSFNAKQSIDKDKNPIPWLTYSAISFLQDRLNKQIKVFEFGSGNSTLWFSKIVKKVVSVEHDLAWYNKIKADMPGNVTLTHKALKYDGEYCRAAKNSQEKFHLIIIDGRDRNNCALHSIDSLTDDGIIIFDNSEREFYSEGQNHLTNNGFKRIDFKGLCPALAHASTTTIFYKPENCLNI